MIPKKRHSTNSLSDPLFLEKSSCSRLLLVSANRFREPYPVYPLGISYLHAAVARRLPHFEVRICDMNLTNNNGLETMLNDFMPQYVGISLRNVDDVNFFARNGFIGEYRELVETIRRKSDAVVIVGGAGFSVFPKLLYELLNPDFGIFGEGENSLCDLLECLENRISPGDIEGLVRNVDGKTIINPRTNYVENSDVIFDDQLLDFYGRESGMLNIQTKRGCPYRCIYCTYPLIEGRCVRTMNAEKIVDTLSFFYQRHQTDYVFFTDSVFNIAAEFNAQLCEAIIRSGIKIKWGAYFTPHNLDSEMLKLYRRAGLAHIEFGTESLSDTQLKNYGKHFTVADIIEKSEMCVREGIYYAHFLILGGYGETDQTVAETFRNSRLLKNTVFFPYVGMRIYPKTKLREIAVAEGKISEDDSLAEPTFYVSDRFNPDALKSLAADTGKAWIFPDEPESEIVRMLRTKKNKKGPLWEYLRKS